MRDGEGMARQKGSFDLRGTRPLEMECLEKKAGKLTLTLPLTLPRHLSNAAKAGTSS